MKNTVPCPMFSISRLIMGLCILCTLFLLSCGLPEYSVLEKPVVLDTGSITSLGFRTTASDPNVKGYALYYKVYSGTSDPDYDVDESYFNPLNTLYDDGGLPPGNVVPKSRGFVRTGEFGKTSLPANIFNIPHTVDSDPIYIDFNPTGEIDDNLRAEPIVERPDPINVTLLQLARGYIDIRPEISSKKLRRFVDDWYFSDASDSYFDGDLRRPPSAQPGSDGGTFTGEPILFSSNSHDRLFISFVVYSVGYDPNTFTILASQPVFLGSVEYTNIIRNDSRASE